MSMLYGVTVCNVLCRKGGCFYVTWAGPRKELVLMSSVEFGKYICVCCCACVTVSVFNYPVDKPLGQREMIL